MEEVLNNNIMLFIDGLKSYFPYISLRISEESYDDSVILFHNYKNAENDDYFIDVFLMLQKKYFKDNGIINVGFSYDCMAEADVYFAETDVSDMNTGKIQSIFITDANKPLSLVKVNNSWNDNVYSAYYEYAVA